MVLVLCLMPAVAMTATITVDTTDGGGVTIDGRCSLSEALVGSNFNIGVDSCAAGASGQDTIAFDPALFSGAPDFLATITLQQSLDIADGGIEMAPPDGLNLRIRGAGANRLFTLSAGDTLIRRIELIDGNSSGHGGALFINSPSNSSSLQLDNVVGGDNVAAGYGGFIGGEIGTGLFNLNIFSSTLSDNSCDGAVRVGGGAIGLDVSADSGFLNILVQDSTWSGNGASSGPGGAISIITDASGSASFGLTIEDSVFEGNTAAGAGGGAIHVDNVRSANGYNVTIRNSRFDTNAASREGAIRVMHTPLASESLDDVLLERNSFVGNNSSFSAGAVGIEFVDTVIRNNLFAQNLSAGISSGNPGALRIDHDGSNSMVISEGGVDIRANTFFENDGNPREMRLDMPLIGAGASGPSFFTANAVQATGESSPACDINNFPNGNYGVSNVPDSLGGCRVGPDSVYDPAFSLQWTTVNHPIHEMAAIPGAASAAIDLWPESACLSQVPGGVPLDTDLLGERRDPSTGLPPDGDGDGDAYCDAGSIEITAPEATFTLSVTLAGVGNGVVEGGSGLIDCPADCSASFSAGTVVELQALPQAGSTFAGWSGDCSGSGACLVTLDEARSVTATFEPSEDEIFADRFSQSP
jgi:predicted outer membrane repeat protein